MNSGNARIDTPIYHAECCLLYCVRLKFSEDGHKRRRFRRGSEGIDETTLGVGGEGGEL